MLELDSTELLEFEHIAILCLIELSEGERIIDITESDAKDTLGKERSLYDSVILASREKFGGSVRLLRVSSVNRGGHTK